MSAELTTAYAADAGQRRATRGAATAVSLFPFSADPAHKSEAVVLLNDGLTATAAAGSQFAWVRCEQGVDAGSGCVTWALRLGKGGGRVYRVGVAASEFRRYNDCGWPRLVWMFQNDAAAADGVQVGKFFDSLCFDQGDLVSMELEREPGAASVLRVGVSGRAAREITDLPAVGVLYPIVCLVSDQQTITMMRVPVEPAAQLAAAHASPPSSPRSRLLTKRVIFLFSDTQTAPGICAHHSPSVRLSWDGTTATVAAASAGGWARAGRGIAPGGGAVRWMVQLGADEEGQGRWIMLGVASEEFKRYRAGGSRLKHVWFFQKAATCSDGNKPVYCISPCFDQGDLVTLELERQPGVDGVLRIQVEGRAAQEIRGLPQDGVLYPIVCLLNDRQKVTMIPVRTAVVPPQPAAPEAASSLEAAAGHQSCIAPMPFSDDAESRSPDIVLSRDRRCATLLKFSGCGWVRGERAIAAACGVVRWAVKLGSEDGGSVYVVGVASHALRDYRASAACSIRHLWAFENAAARADGDRIEFATSCFGRSSTVTLELERQPGVDGVLRIQVEGRAAQEIRGLPQDGVLYPIVCLLNDRQKVTMVPLPR